MQQIDNQSLKRHVVVASQVKLSLSKRNPLLKVSLQSLRRLRQEIDRLEVHNCTLAKVLDSMIPAQCPFERDVKIFHQIVHIPPMCKLNPFYDQLVALKFRSQCYLLDRCERI